MLDCRWSFGALGLVVGCSTATGAEVSCNNNAMLGASTELQRRKRIEPPSEEAVVVCSSECNSLSIVRAKLCLYPRDSKKYPVLVQNIK